MQKSTIVLSSVKVPVARVATLLLFVSTLAACGDTLVGPELKPAVVAGSLNTAVDVSPPLIWQVVSGVQHPSYWYQSDVTVTWSITEPESEYVITGGCEKTVITEDTPGVLMTCSATSTGGNYSTFVVVKRDATPPLLAVSGTESMYDVDDTITIRCTASDAMSGIALLTNCDTPMPASRFGPGTHTVVAEALDHAGHVTRRSVTFTVTDAPPAPTVEEIGKAVVEMVPQPSMRRSLLAKLEAARAAAARGNTATATNIMLAFIREVEAHTPKVITDANGALLINFANALITTFR